MLNAPNDPVRKQSRGTRFKQWWTPERGIVLLLGVSFAVGLRDTFGLGGGPATTAAALGVLGAGIAVLAITALIDRDDVSRSRQRVLDAEQELEEALRSGQPGRRVRADGDTPPPQGSPESPDPALVLPELWKVTHSRLDHYHETVLGQARKSFRSAQLAMWLGFVLLAVFVAVAVKASSTTGAVVAGGLGAVSATLAGYVSRTFVKSQESASEHLRAYFDQPLAFSRYLAAERLLSAGGLEGEKRTEVLAALVLAVAAHPEPELAAADREQTTLADGG
ncbi:hypothetical protein ABZX77_45080 [Streptomyces sp. NPDC004237]|uniref:hypothetical protein n=1 Tax=Streptomyces sp. NPDC004237 TaxID=3154455 RepID=UPI0033A97C14